MSATHANTHMGQEHAPRPMAKKPLTERIWEARLSYAMLLPFFIPFIIFGVIPMVASLYLAFTDYAGSRNRPFDFVGLENFTELVSLEIKHTPRMIDDETGAVLFQCGRSRVLLEEVAQQEADGRVCEAAYINPREVLSDGFRTSAIFFRSDDGAFVLGATDTRFWTAMYNTVRYVSVTVTASVLLGLGLALALQQQSTLNMVLRVLFFLPSVTSAVAITVVWGHLFRGASYGLINSIRLNLGFEVIEFLADPTWILPIVMLLTVWGGMGYNMILFLAGLQSIPQDMYEAATVDGATTLDKFRFITLPLLRPTTIFIVVTSIIGSFQVFDAVYILYAASGGSVGGVLDSALTIVSYLYELGFRNSQMGYASAIAWILFVIIFIFTMINLRVSRANEAY